MGFFAESTLAKSKTPHTLVPRCDACGLYKACKTPKMQVTGDGGLGVLIIAEAPGATEDARGEQLVGKAGQYLRTILQEIGIDLNRDCWKTNSIVCRPLGNRNPTSNEIEYCRPNILQTIKELRPRMIILLGGAAIRSVIGHYWKSDPGGITRWAGWQIPCQQTNAWICPTFHPSYLLREEDPVLDLLFKQQLASAFELEGTPWGVDIPDYTKQVQRIYDPVDVASAIREIIATNIPTAIDYETDRLKPEENDTRIICCSLSNGHKTISYPWVGETITATKEFAKSKCPKIAANIKFEQRWSKRHLGCNMRNWYHDTMQCAHVLDNRRGITGLKFQSYARLGQPPYDDHITPFLKSKHPNDKNRIHEVPLRDVLMYCGLDSLLEYLLCQLQRKDLGYVD